MSLGAYVRALSYDSDRKRLYIFVFSLTFFMQKFRNMFPSAYQLLAIVVTFHSYHPTALTVLVATGLDATVGCVFHLTFSLSYLLVTWYRPIDGLDAPE